MSPPFTVDFEIDGRSVSLETRPDRRLLDLIREDVGITGVREGCGGGECGACSVLLDGRLINSCCMPAVQMKGCNITTIDGFAKTEEFTLIADAFAEAGAVQCGFCTPGFIMATAALLSHNPRPTDEDIRTGLSGILCRCTGYTMVIEAVKIAVKKLAAANLQFNQQTPTSKTMKATSLSPQTIADAIRLLNQGYRPVAGGTDLIVRRHALLKSEPKNAGTGNLFSCRQIVETNRMYQENGRLNIGSSVSLTDIIGFPGCPPLLRKALSSIGSPGIRNAATLAGNICNAGPAADSLPVLYLLNAKIHTSGGSGTRDISIEDFITGPGRTLLQPDELVLSICFKIPDEAAGEHGWIFKKVGTRAANALAKLSVAALWKNENNTITDFRLAIGACAPTVIRSFEAEQLIIGSTTRELEQHLPQYLAVYGKLIRPIDDQRSTAAYRKNTALKLIEHIIKTAGNIHRNENKKW